MAVAVVAGRRRRGGHGRRRREAGRGRQPVGGRGCGAMRRDAALRREAVRRAGPCGQARRRRGAGGEAPGERLRTAAAAASAHATCKMKNDMGRAALEAARSTRPDAQPSMREARRAASMPPARCRVQMHESSSAVGPASVMRIPCARGWPRALPLLCASCPSFFFFFFSIVFSPLRCPLSCSPRPLPLVRCSSSPVLCPLSAPFTARLIPTHRGRRRRRHGRAPPLMSTRRPPRHHFFLPPAAGADRGGATWGVGERRRAAAAANGRPVRARGRLRKRAGWRPASGVGARRCRGSERGAAGARRGPGAPGQGAAWAID